MPDIAFKFFWKKSDADAVCEAGMLWRVTQMLYPEKIEERATTSCV